MSKDCNETLQLWVADLQTLAVCAERNRGNLRRTAASMVWAHLVRFEPADRRAFILVVFPHRDLVFNRMAELLRAYLTRSPPGSFAAASRIATVGAACSMTPHLHCQLAPHEARPPNSKKSCNRQAEKCEVACPARALD